MAPPTKVRDNGLLTLDFETEGIDKNPIYQPPKPVGVSIKWGAAPSEYLAWGHPTGNNCTPQEGHRKLMRALVEAKGEFLAHNSAFECAILQEYYDWNIKKPQKVHDTMYLLFLADPYAQSFALKPSAERVLGLAPDEQTELRDWILAHVPESKASDWGAYICRAPGALVGRYACGDTDRTFLLYQELYPRILQSSMLEAYRREQELMPILAASSRRGVRIDVDALGRDIELYLAAKKKCEEYIYGVLGEFELSKDAQLAEALDRKGLISEWVLTPTGKRSVARKNLTGRVKDPQLLDYLAYHGVLTTCLGTFAGPWLAQALEEGGRVHPQWNQVRGDRGAGGDIDGTRTGRMSCIARGERVHTQRGEVPIEQVVVGDRVFTHELRWRDVCATITNGQRPVFRYELSNGKSVVCTDDHRFYDGCDWLPIQEFAYGSFKGVDVCAPEYSRSADAIPGYRETADHWGSGAGDDDYVAQCDCGHPLAISGRAEGVAGYPPLSSQVGEFESAVWQDRASAPKFHRRLWGYLCDSVGGRAQAASTQDSDGSCTGACPWDAAHALDSTPHRRESTEQRDRQSSSLHEQWAPANSQQNAELRYRSVEVTKVQFVGIREVFDLTVEEDHSFGIAGVFAHNCKSPNLQNPPTDFENLRIPDGLPPMIHMRSYLLPEEGHVWLKRDFSAQEMRILAHFAEGRLYEAFREKPETDPHQTVKEIIDGFMGGDMPRKYVKITGFGIMYGRGVPNLSAALGVDEVEGKRIRDAYYAALPEVRELSYSVRDRGKRGQFIRTWGGRVYYREPNLDRDLSYKLLNYLIQGSAADQTKQAMVDWESSRAPTDTLLAAVHDEINISAPSEDAAPAMIRLRTAMNKDRFDVPFLSEGFKGPNWSDIEGYEP